VACNIDDPLEALYMTDNRCFYRLRHIDGHCCIEKISADQARQMFRALPKQYAGFSQLFNSDGCRQLTEKNNEEFLKREQERQAQEARLAQEPASALELFI
jgi:hypothetical protein